MRILFIINAANADVDRTEDTTPHQKTIQECYEALCDHVREQVNEEIGHSTKLVLEMEDVEALSRDVREASVVIIVGSVDSPNRIPAIFRRLSEMEERAGRLHLLGKWAGVILLNDGSTSDRLEGGVILQEISAAGMVPLPYGFVKIGRENNSGHLRLGKHAAIAISANSDWNGINTWRIQAA